MTVCVAAICDGNTIFGAADRMLTAGNIQFQPATSKIYQLTSSIALMVSGDMALQAEIIGDLQRYIVGLLSADPPPDWFRVKDVALWYCHFYREIKARKAEREILSPLGLTKETFISRQSELSPDLVTKLATELINHELPGTSAIFGGVDRDGAHLYVASGSDVSCNDAAGFAAIGMGAYHANSHLMFSGHVRGGPIPRTLLLLYTAKKRAEVAPGVGIDTDMFMVGPTLGSFNVMYRHIVDSLERIYQKSKSGYEKVDRKSEGAANEYIAQITSEAAQQSQQSVGEVNDGEAPASGPSPPRE